MADASKTGSLLLRSATSIDVLRISTTSLTGQERYFANVGTTVDTTDTVMILGGGTVTNGFLRLTFDLTGVITEAADAFTGDGFNPDNQTCGGTGDCFFAQELGFILVNGISQSFGPAAFSAGTANISRQLTLDVPLAFGTPQSVLFRFSNTSTADMLFPEGYRITTDFMHTLGLSTAVILDGDKQLLTGASLVSESNYLYPGSSTPTVPEPATLSLVTLGALGFFRTRNAGRRLGRTDSLNDTRRTGGRF